MLVKIRIPDEMWQKFCELAKGKPSEKLRELIKNEIEKKGSD